MRFSTFGLISLAILTIFVLATILSMQRSSGATKRAAAPPAASEAQQRQDAIRSAFVHSWTAYERFAWGHDELHPLTNRSNDVWGGFAVTMVDALDTAKLMGLEAEFGRAVTWLDGHFTMRRDHWVNVFELSIRVLGGLLGAFDLSGDPRLLRLAEEAGRALLGAFPPGGDGLPAAELNLATGSRRDHPWVRRTVLAEAGSVQLELGRLQAVMRAAGRAAPPSLAPAAQSVATHLLRTPSVNGLYPRLLGASSYAINGGAPGQTRMRQDARGLGPDPDAPLTRL